MTSTSALPPSGDLHAFAVFVHAGALEAGDLLLRTDDLPPFDLGTVRIAGTRVTSKGTPVRLPANQIVEVIRTHSRAGVRVFGCRRCYSPGNLVAQTIPVDDLVEHVAAHLTHSEGTP